MLTYFLIGTAVSLVMALTFRESSFWSAMFVMGVFFSGLLYAGV